MFESMKKCAGRQPLKAIQQQDFNSYHKIIIIQVFLSRE
jgi:hypothetical protein